MKAEDVRIGNLVYYHIVDKLNEPEERDAENIIDCFDIAQMVGNPESNEYKPIPLTEEWLLKFGFTHEGGYLWDCKDLGYQRFIKNHLIKGYFETHYANKHIQYIHQLQNLYFALTGKELTL